MSTTNSASAIEQLRQRVNGEVLLPGDESYAVARQTKALVQDRFPSIIVRPTSAEDVSEAVKFAVANDLPLAVRGGGHSIAGHSTISGSLNIDLSTMRGVTIDVEKQTARVQGGAHSRDLAIPAAEVGLALTTGDTGSVGVGGLVTGGGIGYFVRKYGLAADRVLSATVVTANGDILTASATENPDLFWAVRGGGGNFGVVVDYEFQLFPVPAVYGGALILPATPETVRGYLDYAPNAPENLSTIGNIVHMPPLPFVPEERHGERVLLILAVFDGDEAEGAKAMAPLRALAEPVADTVGMIPYPAMFDYMEWAEVNHEGEFRMMFTDVFPVATIDVMLASIDNATSPFACVHLRGLGGAIARIPAGEQRVPAPQPQVLRRHSWRVDGPGRRPAGPHQLDAGYLEQDFAPAAGRVRQLSFGRRRSPRSGGLPGRGIHPPGRSEGEVRPEQRLPLQPERASCGGDAEGRRLAKTRTHSTTERPGRSPGPLLRDGGRRTG